ncbi:hypothetical protein COCC4DRAFT_198701 [Bipolaris maydis ATCC 48331]|uniref:Uncharacterized protein n=2 Tax=Cochliobolus heterostrophus TaxID=5016 RepID=M2UGD2_COCH5|nr:uncharacterized protein COCC4DRAFT_198701 [Bipolaris maydis ATCC 48331]EMD86997.1 hypothetical protein COCHEDRAFT_1197867 [Bipolaris maydis C5]ENI04008.1 hypothetical protein COCC4DRAFT_198701 [Bipolaris maydis ATCC 48331]
MRASMYASNKVLTYIIHMYIKVHVYPADSAIWRSEETQCGTPTQPAALHSHHTRPEAIGNKVPLLVVWPEQLSMCRGPSLSRIATLSRASCHIALISKSGVTAGAR